MHRLILCVEKGREVDHLNHNGLDNRRANLRIVNRSGNNLNRRNVRGYYYERSTGRYRAQIEHGKRRLNLGRFDTALEARRAYLLAKGELES